MSAWKARSVTSRSTVTTWRIAWKVQGPHSLLLHGIAGSSRTWRDVIPLLIDRFTVIAPDFMGHGLSEKPVGDYSLGAFASGVRDLLEVLDVDRATVVGQSFGGGVAMQLAYQHPELCDRLVLVDSGGLGREVSWILRLMTLPGSEYVMPLLFPGFVRDWGDSLLRSVNDRGIRLGRVHRDVERVRIAGRGGQPAGLRPHHQIRHRSGWPDGQRHGSSLPGVPDADVDHLGGPGRHHPGEPCAGCARSHSREPSGDHRGRRPLPADRGAGAVRCCVGRLRGHDAARSPRSPGPPTDAQRAIGPVPRISDCASPHA